LEIGVSSTVFPDWLQIMIHLISASQVATIIGVSHWRPATLKFLIATLDAKRHEAVVSFIH
jgi:hypothetical protein